METEETKKNSCLGHKTQLRPGKQLPFRYAQTVIGAARGNSNNNNNNNNCN